MSSFANTDYALARTLVEAIDQRWIMISYDIWCQYHRHLQKRFDSSFPDQAKLLERVRGAIPKMHIKNHVESCETWGENIEGSWAEQNQTAGSTKEQNEGHRHDSLDDFFGFWNWSKMRQLFTRDAAFSTLTSNHPPKLIAQWESMDDVPKLVNGKVCSVYEAQFKDVEAERISSLSNQTSDKTVLGNAQLINIAIELEGEQYRIRKIASLNEDTESLAIARARLEKKIVEWKSGFYAQFPHLDHTTIDSLPPEREPLVLPSSLNAHIRQAFNLQALINAKLKLRKGQAYDALVNLRLALRIWNAHYGFKIREVRGQDQNTRAQNVLKNRREDVDIAAATYRRARVALVNLGIPEDDDIFRPLLDTELYMKNTNKPAKLGDNRREDPWFWYTGRGGNTLSCENSTWAIEMDRVKWFRDRAARDRAREEKEILECEFERAQRSFSEMAKAWKALAKKARTVYHLSQSSKTTTSAIPVFDGSALLFDELTRADPSAPDIQLVLPRAHEYSPPWHSPPEYSLPPHSPPGHSGAPIMSPEFNPHWDCYILSIN
ncbi:hypothetical protein F5887DRAFT_925190 [Amanita rubescens]|nr:hypothetical protein F5887DRAFT_925190 [Amanita rubescens]